MHLRFILKVDLYESCAHHEHDSIAQPGPFGHVHRLGTLGTHTMHMVSLVWCQLPFEFVKYIGFVGYVIQRGMAEGVAGVFRSCVNQFLGVRGAHHGALVVVEHPDGVVTK